MNLLHDRRIVLALVAIACAALAIGADRPVFATVLFPAVFISMFRRTRLGPPSA
ncbi:hypothetical protein [Lysobacter claricitrinus]|uniref:hypothetical protein n=1 Tax=Lysobacter claricitrinus TaxID=3367728 RepID=UPI0037DAEF6F